MIQASAMKIVVLARWMATGTTERCQPYHCGTGGRWFEPTQLYQLRSEISQSTELLPRHEALASAHATLPRPVHHLRLSEQMTEFDGAVISMAITIKRMT